MGLEGGVGLTTILLGAATVDDVVQQWRDSSLYVLPAGQIPPNPSEILGSEPMETLFDHLTKEFDYVLVDSPPVLPVIDAVVINKLVGGLLFVVAADRTRKRDLSSALKAADDGRRQPPGSRSTWWPAARPTRTATATTATRAESSGTRRARKTADKRAKATPDRRRATAPRNPCSTSRSTKCSTSARMLPGPVAVTSATRLTTVSSSPSATFQIAKAGPSRTTRVPSGIAAT